MGVIRQLRKVCIASTRSTDTDDQTTNTSTDDEAVNTIQSGGTRTSSQEPLQPQSRLPASPGLARARLGHKLRLKQGRRSKQRCENERMLMAMYGIDSEEAVTGSDIQQETRSYFVELLEADNQQLLDKFLNNQEEKFFNEEKETFKKKVHTITSADEFKADEAFMKIGFNMRAAMKKNLPLGMLQGIEQNINESFMEDPHFDYVAEDLSSFERLLLHALCAYNDLNSHSYDCNGKRKVKVANPYPIFYKKDPSLCQYLIERQRR